MKPYLLLLITILLTSCISDTQQTGLDEISKHYNAKTSYSKGYNKTAGEETIKSFKIKISNSKMLDSLNPITTCPNIALMLYSKLTLEEQSAYTHIQVALKNKEGDFSFNYEPKTLDIGLDQVDIFTAFSDNLMTQNYKGMATQVDPKLMIKDLDKKIKNYFDILITEHGKIKKYTRIGFGSVNPKNGEKLFRFIGYLTFNDDYNRGYFVDVPMQIENNYIQGYDFVR